MKFINTTSTNMQIRSLIGEEFHASRAFGQVTLFYIGDLCKQNGFKTHVEEFYVDADNNIIFVTANSYYVFTLSEGDVLSYAGEVLDMKTRRAYKYDWHAADYLKAVISA